MFTNQFFDLLLNLGDDWKVTNVIANYKIEEITIKIEYVAEQAECPNTLEMCKIYDHAQEREWRHLDTMQFKTFISCRLPRVKNKDGNVLTIVPPWASKHERHTYLFEHAIIDLLGATKNQTKTAKLMRCGFNIINRILHISTERGLKRRNLESLKFHHLSIDEKSFKKGHEYVSVLSHPDSGCVIDVSEGRTIESASNLIDKALTPRQQSEVRTISMDMWQAYISTIKGKMPNAEIVHDRFHLIKYLNDAIDKVRKREVKKENELKNSKYVLLKNECNLTEKQRIKFEAIRDANYEVSKAWQIKENFKALFNLEADRIDAFVLYMRWAQESYHRGIKEISKVVNMFDNHMRGVVSALLQSFSNAMAERLNGKIQEVKLMARGYRQFQNFRSAILFFHGGLNLYPLK
jgi:transposase